MSEPRPRFTPGNRLGKYTIRRTISRGRLTEVCRAFNPDYKRDVAIKLFHAPSASQCFEHEVRQVMALRHPNIIQIYDFGLSQDWFYIVMELVQGTNLRDLLSSNPTGLGREDLFRIFSQIASAVACGHDQGVLHGNIKPDNVLLDTHNRPVLTDFNLPCLKADIASDNTTPAYMAPEQTSQGLITPQTDIYALGITLYEMSTGNVPFRGSTRQEVVDQHLNTLPTPPSQIRIGLDPRVEKVILKALDKNPANRHTSAREMVIALEQQEAITEFSTLSLDRNAAQEIRKRKSEISRFQRTRMVDSESSQALPLKKHQIPWVAIGVIGLIILAAGLAILLL